MKLEKSEYFPSVWNLHIFKNFFQWICDLFKMKILDFREEKFDFSLFSRIEKIMFIVRIVNILSVSKFHLFKNFYQWICNLSEMKLLNFWVENFNFSPFFISIFLGHVNFIFSEWKYWIVGSKYLPFHVFLYIENVFFYCKTLKNTL